MMTGKLHDLTVAIMREAGELDRTWRARLADLPSPGAEIGLMLHELVEVELDIARHMKEFSDDRRKEHRYLECTGLAETSAPCDECEDWRRICSRKDKAQEAILRYARSLELVTPTPESNAFERAFDCLNCKDELVPGVLFPWNQSEGLAVLERCDECKRFECDDEAAEALANVLPRPFHVIKAGHRDHPTLIVAKQNRILTYDEGKALVSALRGVL